MVMKSIIIYCVYIVFQKQIHCTTPTPVARVNGAKFKGEVNPSNTKGNTMQDNSTSMTIASIGVSWYMGIGNIPIA